MRDERDAAEFVHSIHVGFAVMTVACKVAKPYYFAKCLDSDRGLLSPGFTTQYSLPSNSCEAQGMAFRL